MASFSIHSGEIEPQLFDAMEFFSFSCAISTDSDCKLYKDANWNLNKNIYETPFGTFYATNISI